MHNIPNSCKSNAFLQKEQTSRKQIYIFSTNSASQGIKNSRRSTNATPGEITYEYEIVVVITSRTSCRSERRYR